MFELVPLDDEKVMLLLLMDASVLSLTDKLTETSLEAEPEVSV